MHACELSKNSCLSTARVGAYYLHTCAASTRSWLFHTRLAESRPQTQVNRSDSHQAPHRILSQQKASAITTAPPRMRGPLGRAFDRGSIHIRTLGLTFHACTPLAKRRVCEINIEPGCAPLSLSCTCVCTWCDPVVQQDACWLGGELCSCCLVPLARTSTGAIATGGADADLAWFCDLFVVIINRYSVRLREYLINRLGLKTVQRRHGRPTASGCGCTPLGRCCRRRAAEGCGWPQRWRVGATRSLRKCHGERRRQQAGSTPRQDSCE
jgi:hypothetical protein